MSATNRKATNPADGTTIAWTEQGTGRPLLLVMGLGATGLAWEPHVRSLARSFRCLILDNRGVGGSDAPAGPYSTSVMADDCAAVIRAAGYRTVSVIGISMGGAIAQNLALQHPTLVERLVVASSWARPNDFSEDVFEELRDLHSKLTPSEFERRLQLLIWSPEGYRARADQLRSDRAKLVSSSVNHVAFAAQCDACLSHDALAKLSSIAVPTLVTAGDRDAFIPISSSMEVADAVPSSRMEVFGDAGHAHHWEALDHFNTLCQEFLNAN